MNDEKPRASIAKTQPEDDVVLTVPEAAILLRISRQSAYEAVRRGELPSIRIGKRLLVPRRILMRLLEGT